MSVISDLISAVKSTTPDLPVRELIVGLNWTAVTSRETGLAATYADGPCCYAREVEDVGKLHKRSAYGLIEFLSSSHPLEMSIGLAALNSLIPVDVGNGIQENARDLMLDRCPKKNVAIIGHFPFAGLLKEKAASLSVLELDPAPGELPASAAPEIIPNADLVGLTASTLMNGTFDDLSKLFAPHSYVVMIGPSTPMNTILFDYGVDVLAGSHVTNAEVLLPYISQGSSLHRAEGLSRVTFARQKK